MSDKIALIFKLLRNRAVRKLVSKVDDNTLFTLIINVAGLATDDLDKLNKLLDILKMISPENGWATFLTSDEVLNDVEELLLDIGVLKLNFKKNIGENHVKI